MKKIIYLIFPFIMYALLSECTGYKPIFASGNISFDIAEHKIEGNKILGKKIYLKLKTLSNQKKDEQNKRSLNFLISTSKKKNATSKNSAGKILEYKITLVVKITVTDFITDEKILNETLNSSITYKVQDQYSDTIKLENKSTEDLLDKTYQEFVIKLSQKIIS